MADSMNVTGVTPQLQQGTGSSSANSVPARPVAPVSEASQAAVEQAQISVEDIQATVQQLNEFMSQGQRSLSFSVDDSVGEVVVRVTDKETSELIRQIPSEEVLKFKQHLDAMLGMLFNEKA
ncbi:MAG: flagellar protein FlaG [Motiliproteus sp.]|nr:flagellar protein FlaG [Motiliproteus sp.]MCW9051995.1 flagellar protein FlaG [Motiliproteus sp.]